ncbi:MAG TPA: DEAD/DEAH box helicase [Solirubrobacteraceae bacterium]|jgi:ATP-dependent RNA helicase RhlE|nr:DEAD/DEAH box helicase [Solirubrobacteraceae bacterium]
MQSFAQLGVSRAVAAALSRRGIDEPFPVQRLVLGDVLDGRDVLVKSPTGSGKTLAFGIALVERIQPGDRGPAGLIVAPTRELASQIAGELRDIAGARGLRVAAVYGGVGMREQATRAARSHIVVATPGRLEDQLQRRAFSLDSVRILVLDEADRMLDMGFRPAIDRIVEACPAERQTLLFSATLDGVAGKLAARYTTQPVRHENVRNEADGPRQVEHRFVPVRDGARLEALVAELDSERQDRALVFVRTKRGADRLVKRLGALGVESLAIHGNKSQRQRDQALARFQSGGINTLVATDVAARGIDVDGVTHVINFDPPDDHDAYVHRVGRTARAGASGIGITLVSPGERHEMRQLAHRLGLHKEFGVVGDHAGARASQHTGQRSGRPPRPRRRRARSNAA